MRTDVRRAYHIARTDIIARVRSQKLLIFFAVVIYVGYLINSGSFGVFYTVSNGPNVNGALTSHLVGLNAGMAGSAVMLLAGFYVLRGSLERDDRHGHLPVVTSSQTSKPVYLLGKLLSNTAVGVLTAAVLAGAAVVNHSIYGVGATDPIAISWPVFVMVVPLTVFVGAVAMLFDTINLLAGTLGRIAYFFGAIFLLSAQSARPETAVPAAVPTTVKALDIVGLTLAYDLTFESIQAAVPGFESSFANFGTGGSNAQTFRYEGGPWPAWFFAQRLGTVAVGLAVTLVAALPFNWFRTTGGVVEKVRRRLPLDETPPETATQTASNPQTPTDTADPAVSPSPVGDDVTIPPVTRRGAGGFRRVLTMELRRLLRGQPRWWYLGAGLLAVVPAGIALTGGGTEGAARGLLSLVAVWPLFVWSQIGSQTARHGIRPQVLTSDYPVGQLVGEWIAGCLITIVVGAGAFAIAVATGGPTALIGVTGLVIFPPSLALAAGLWTGSPRLFEALYLGLWYIGPLNGGFVADFAGVTARGTSLGVPIVFAAVGVGLVVVAAQTRRVYTNLG
ncbi:hypothetical protein PM033_15535 [Halorubrum ezzemoulense]|uniref:hypothetical protein n=1 Tax=Halorubrum ezzemoulense TaxID=337243 RepID=UPI00232D4C3F|nr:hypothetical protein [Halorubrum ezzemoulense]MDB2253155.1 hypothetical protein [Halorubrum ezzemoulense]